MKRCFYFKINDSKTDEPIKLSKQADRVAKFLVNRYGINYDKYSFVCSYNDDDFVKEKKTLRIAFYTFKKGE